MNEKGKRRDLSRRKRREQINGGNDLRCTQSQRDKRKERVGLKRGHDGGGVKEPGGKREDPEENKSPQDYVGVQREKRQYCLP